MSDRYRVFCAYGPHYREPGCGWEAFVDSEVEARLIGERHARGQTHATDYERYVDTGSDQDV